MVSTDTDRQAREELHRTWSEFIEHMRERQRADRAEAQLTALLADAETLRRATGLPDGYLSPGGVTHAGVVMQAVGRLLETAAAIQRGRR